jgi:putative ABC transport system permease protein
MNRFSAFAGDTLVALRQNPLRSLLSVLGLVIGVAALVGILALADGMERYAREQIGTTTDFQNISITPRTLEQIDGVTLRRHEIVAPTLEDAASLADHLGEGAVVVLTQQRPAEITFDTLRTAALLFAADAGFWSLGSVEVQSGRLFTGADVEAARPALVLSAALAERLGGNAASLIGRQIQIGGANAEIVGVLSADHGRPAEAYGPYTAFSTASEQRPASFYVRALRAEEVATVADRVKVWLDERFAEGKAAFTVSTNEARTRQIREGMLLFKLVFGLITGISVVVGGVGVMNVLLVTVTERTREIGIRKAVGARRRDIQRQFLAEALTVAGVGSAIGLIVGLVGVFALIPVIRYFTDVPFNAAITGQTLLLVSGLAIGVGVLFGTYPAARAARLDPVEAMRHE